MKNKLKLRGKTMDKTQDKFLKLLEILNVCRQKLYATYNLFVTNLEQTKEVKAELGEKYEQLVDVYNEIKQLNTLNKPVKTRMANARKKAQTLKAEYDEQVSSVGSGMADCERCRKTYKHEVALCCDAYKQLGVGGEEKIVKGYKQQVRLTKRILEKIDLVKANFKGVKEEIKELATMFYDLFDKINEKTVVLS